MYGQRATTAKMQAMANVYCEVLIKSLESDCVVYKRLRASDECRRENVKGGCHRQKITENWHAADIKTDALALALTRLGRT